MKRFLSIGVVIVLGMLMLSSSCDKTNDNPYIPNVRINITIDPNSTQFLELNIVGGWLYLDETSMATAIPYPSRGIIVYRFSQTEFRAFERQPPNEPNLCCDNSLCTRLIVDEHYPFVKDTCNDNLYQMIDGSLFEGAGNYPLIQYNALFDGGLLHIFN